VWYIRYFRALFGSAWGIALLVAGFISTAMTFVPLYAPGFHLPRWILVAVAVAAFLFAPLRLYVQQAQQIAQFEASKEKPRRAQLVVKEEEGGSFIRMYDRTQGGVEVGLYVEPHVTIENKGPRTATIESYDIRFPEVPQIQAQEKLRPTPMTMVPGAVANHSVGNGNNYVRGYVEVGGERLIGPLQIPFVVYSALPEKLHPLKCELTVRDTEGNTASAVLDIHQRG
jgi:hypothetical protein